MGPGNDRYAIGYGPPRETPAKPGPERTVADVADAVVRIAVAGAADPVTRVRTEARVRELVGEAVRVSAAGHRKSLAAAWSAYLSLLLADRELVLDIRYGEPELWRRLCAAVLGEDRG